MQLLQCYSQVVQAFEDGNSVDVLYLDIRKAFDSVPHEELLFKLWRLGITGPLWNWFRAYLRGRHHYVQHDGHSSPSLPVISGGRGVVCNTGLKTIVMAGLYYGHLGFEDQVPGDSLLQDYSLIPFPQSDPIGMLLTEFHCVLLYRDRSVCLLWVCVCVAPYNYHISSNKRRLRMHEHWPQTNARGNPCEMASLHIKSFRYATFGLIEHVVKTVAKLMSK